MISLRSLSIPMLALVAVLSGCTSETTPSSNTASTPQQQVAQSDTTTTTPAATPGLGHRGPGGPDMLIGAALNDSALNLTDAQKTTITNLKSTLHTNRPAFDQSHAAALAAAIRKGDLSTLPAPTGPDQATVQAHFASSAQAIQTLHDTLTSDQRTQLVTDLQNHAIGGHHGAPGATWAKGGENETGGPGGGPGGFRGEVGGPFAKDLNLTADQQAKLQALAPAKPTDAQIAQMKANFQAMHAEMSAKLETFKADSFDATAFVTPSTKLQAPGGPDMHQNHLANLVSVLTPAQRETLAQKIEAGPAGAPAAGE